MTTRGQNLRSSTPGQTPAAGTRASQVNLTGSPSPIARSVTSTPARTRSRWSYGAVLLDSPITRSAITSCSSGSSTGLVSRSRRALSTPANGRFTGGSVLVNATAPANPTPGDMWFDSTGWPTLHFLQRRLNSSRVGGRRQSELFIAGGVYLPLGGGTMSGSLTLAGNPVNPLDASIPSDIPTKNCLWLAGF